MGNSEIGSTTLKRAQVHEEPNNCGNPQQVRKANTDFSAV